MTKTKSLYHGHRFPVTVISHAVRWHFRFQLSLRDIEEWLFERDMTVSDETIRRWCEKFGVGLVDRGEAARQGRRQTFLLTYPLRSSPIAHGDVACRQIPAQGWAREEALRSRLRSGSNSYF